MSGTPTWLASVSRQSRLTGGRLATPLWSQETVAASIDLLRRMIGPAGNPARERVFRMQITLCLHRAATPEEVAALPAYFHEAQAVDLAGGPVEIVWESEPGLPSTQPCHKPRQQRLDPNNPLLWIPLDCGDCPPCRARRVLDSQMDAKIARLENLLAR